MSKNITIDHIESSLLSNSDLLSIAEIEKDMWAHGIGEYIKCNDCGNIDSKSDIYGGLESKIYLETVSEIERILSKDSINCTCCNSTNTSFIYDEKKYINEIINRKDNTIKYFISTMRNDVGSILGFVDGYIDSFDTIYDNEFSLYYPNKEIIINKLDNIFDRQIPNELLVWSSIGMIEKYKNFIYTYKLIKDFFNSIPEDKENTPGIAESVIGNNMHNLYKKMGAINLNIGDNSDPSSKNNDFKSDLFIHKTAIIDYKRQFNGSFRDIIKLIKK